MASPKPNMNSPLMDYHFEYHKKFSCVYDISLIIHQRLYYLDVFLDFMDFMGGTAHARDQTFAPSLLRQIKPHHIVDFMHTKAYGKKNVDY